MRSKCPKCGKILRIPDGMAGKRGKCPACGNVLTVPPKSTVTQAVPPLRAGACPKCGKTMSKGAVVCIACGFDTRTGKIRTTELQSAQTARSGKAALSGRSLRIALALAGVGVTAVIVLLSIVFSGSGNGGTQPDKEKQPAQVQEKQPQNQTSQKKQTAGPELKFPKRRFEHPEIRVDLQDGKNLADLLASEFVSQRLEAVFLLPLEGRRWTTTFIKMLKEDPSPDVRCELIKGLDRIGDDRAIGPIAEAMLTDRYLCVRVQAALVLGKLGDQRAVPLLIDALGLPVSSTDPSRQLLQVITVGRSTQSELATEIKCEAARLLGKLGDANAIDPLIAGLSHSEPAVCKAAATSLGELGDVNAVPALILALGDNRTTIDKDDSIRGGSASSVAISAVRALEKLGDPRAVEPLVAILADAAKRSPERQTRPYGREPIVLSLPHAAESALVKIGPAAVERLADLAAKAADRSSQNHAVSALAKIGDRRATPALLAVLESSKPYIERKKIIEILGDLKDGHAVDPLIRELKNKDLSACAAAAKALGKIGDPKAVDPLCEVIKEKRQIAPETTRAPGPFGRRVPRPTTGFGPPRALSPFRQEVPQAVKAKREIVQEAIVALGRIGDRRAVPTLTGIVEVPHPSPTALLVLARFERRLAANKFIAILDDSSTAIEDRWIAAVALGKLREAKAIAGLIALSEVPGPRTNWVNSSDREFLDALPVVEGLPVSLPKTGPTLPITHALCRIGPPAVDPLIVALKRDVSEEDTRKTKPSNRRACAASALGWIGDKRAVAPLIDALNDDDSRVLVEAATGLGRLGDPRAVGPLVSLFQDELNYTKARIAAAEALVDLGAPRAVEVLRAATNDGRLDIRQTANRLLKKLESNTPGDTNP